MGKTVRAQIVSEYLTKFPNSGDATIARKIFKENKLSFDSEEQARSCVRYQRGHKGKAKRHVANEFKKPITYDSNPYKLPESYAEPKKPFVLPKGCNNILLVSDFHVPYHDNNAITAAFKYGIDNKVNCIFINGDLLDFHMLSRFEKDPRARSVKDEFDTARALLESMRKTFPNASIYWLKGNHCKRYERWLFAKAPEIFDDEYYQLENRLGLANLNIKLLDDMQLVKAGKLFITHGHLMIKGVFAPVNAARGLYMRAKASAIIGHTHSVSAHTEKDIKGDIVACWSTGCLCELEPDYSPFGNKYAHGFAHITVESNGHYNVKNFMILKGKIL